MPVKKGGKGGQGGPTAFPDRQIGRIWTGKYEET